MPIMVHSVPVSAKKFTKDDLEISKKYINPDVYPGLYNKEDIPEGLEYISRQLININEIINDDEEYMDVSISKKSRHTTPDSAATQTARVYGRGEQAERVFYQIRTYGYKLDKIPMSVAIFPDGEKYLINGRTRLQELRQQGFKNIIADVYNCTSREGYHEAMQLFNVREDPYSPHTMEDIVMTACYAIRRGWIKDTFDDIKKKVEKVAPGSFLPNEVNKIVLRVLNNKNISSSISWTTKSAFKEIRKMGYVDNVNNNGIYYFVYSAEAPVKAIPAAAMYLKGELGDKKVKELRVVIHTATLQGSDPELSWKTKIDSFRKAWTEHSQAIKDGFFTKDSEFRNTIKLFGVLPAVSGLKDEYPMDKLVMFHIGKLRDNLFSALSFNDKMSSSVDAPQPVYELEFE